MIQPHIARLLLPFIFIVSFISAGAQQRAGRIGIGVQAGWSVSKISGSTFDSKSGFIGGISATTLVFGNFYVQPEVNFQQLGGKYQKDAFLIGDVRYRYTELKMNFLNIPILLKYRFAPTNLSVYIGPQVGIKLSAKDKVGEGQTFDLNNVKTTDFSGIYGLEWLYPLPDENVAVVLNARYMTGFTNFAKYAYVNMPEDSYKNNAFVVTLGFRF